MDNFLLIFCCLALGQLCRRVPKFPKTTAQSLNSFVIYISFPALVLVQVPKLIAEVAPGAHLLIPVSMAWILFMGSWVIFGFLGPRLGWTKGQTGAIILTAGLANTSFVGFPLLEALIGAQAIQMGILVDQLGTFLTCSTLGILVAGLYQTKGVGEARVSRRRIAKNVLLFPPFIVLILTALVSFAGLPIPTGLHSVATKLAATLVPLALFAVGYGLNINSEASRPRLKLLSLGLGYKLFLAPLFFFILYTLLFKARGEMVLVTLLEAAMAPMITSAVIANEYELDGELANQMVGIGIILSLMTVWLWNEVLASLLI